MPQTKVVSIAIPQDLHREMQDFTSRIGLKLRSLPAILWRAWSEIPDERKKELILSGFVSQAQPPPTPKRRKMAA